MKRLAACAATAVAITLVLALSSTIGQTDDRGTGLRSMGGFVAEAAQEGLRRLTDVELEGGQRVTGEIDVPTLTVLGDAGRYAIEPARVKMIKFLKPETEPADEEPAEDFAKVKAAMIGGPMRKARMFAQGFVPDPVSGVMSVPTRGKVVTTPGREIVGTIYLPRDFKITLDVGTLYLAPGKLRTITFSEPPAPAKTTEKPANDPVVPAADGFPKRETQAKAAAADRSPRVFWVSNTLVGNQMLITAPGDNRVAVYDPQTKKSWTIELSPAQDAPVVAVPITGQGLLALDCSGPKVTRLAVFQFGTEGGWWTQDLREPSTGRVSPILGPGTAVYIAGRHAYAFSAWTHRWEIVELPEGFRPNLVVRGDGVYLEGDGHVYFFRGETSKWEQLDLRAILNTAGARTRK